MKSGRNGAFEGYEEREHERLFARTSPYCDAFRGEKVVKLPRSRRIAGKPSSDAPWGLLDRDRYDPSTAWNRRNDLGADMSGQPFRRGLSLIERRRAIHRPTGKWCHHRLERRFDGMKIHQQVLGIQIRPRHDHGDPPVVAVEFLHDPSHGETMGSGKSMTDFNFVHGSDTTDQIAFGPITPRSPSS